MATMSSSASSARRDGQIVVAQTDEGEATLKRYYLEKNRIRLEPANAAMKPIYVRNANSRCRGRRGAANRISVVAPLYDAQLERSTSVLPAGVA